MSDARTTIVVRLPKSLLKRIERQAKENRKRLGVSWSRNDEIVSILNTSEPPPKIG